MVPGARHRALKLWKWFGPTFLRRNRQGYILTSPMKWFKPTPSMLHEWDEPYLLPPRAETVFQAYLPHHDSQDVDNVHRIQPVEDDVRDLQLHGGVAVLLMGQHPDQLTSCFVLSNATGNTDPVWNIIECNFTNMSNATWVEINDATHKVETSNTGHGLPEPSFLRVEWLIQRSLSIADTYNLSNTSDGHTDQKNCVIKLTY